MKTTPTQLIEYDHSGAYLKPSPLLANVRGTKRYSAYYQRINLNSNPATNPSILTVVQPPRYVRAMTTLSLSE